MGLRSPRQRSGRPPRARRSADPPGAAVDADLAWSLLLAIRRAGRRGVVPEGFGLGLDGESKPALLAPDDPRALLTVATDDGWSPRARPVDPAVGAMIDLYLPVALAGVARPLVIGHLGVSLDGHVATRDGASHYITGPENIRHMHRLRALVDAVIVGATTVAQDDPRLTTRRARGDNPVRVVIDPGRRLARDRRIFRDEAAETLLFCAEERVGAEPERHGAAQVLGLPAGSTGVSLEALVARLRARGLHALLVEGGGVTVSRFLGAGRLDRLQLAVAPLITGSGRPGIALPPAASLAEAMRPRCRHFRMGADLLFDCDLRADSS